MRRFNVRSLSFGERNEAERRLFCDVAPFSLGGIDYEVAGGGSTSSFACRALAGA